MNETILTWLVFILAFGGMVLIHEFGHYIVARWVKVEVEEFGIGLPTPGAVTLWSNKGYFLLDDGGRIEIPSNFRLPINWNDLIDNQVKLTVDRVDDRLVMRSIEVVRPGDAGRSASSRLELDNIYVDQNGNVTQPREHAGQTAARRVIKAGKATGDLEIMDVITEVHPGTRFTLNWLPLGGFVRPKGENDPNVPGGLAAASPWKRLAVLVAGPLMNLITAVIVFSIIINQSGGIITTQPENSGPTRLLVTSVVPGSPAEAGGFQVGDTILRGAGNPIEGQEDLRLVVEQNIDKPVAFVVDRNGEQVELTATPLMNQQEQRPMIGVSFCTGCVFASVDTVGENISYSLRYTGSQIRALVTLPVKLLRGTAAPEEGRLIGLKGIFDIMRQSVSNDVEASQTPSTPAAASGPLDKPVQTLFLIASLSISLGLFNLFPFPALDGGRIIFVLPELIFRRRVSPQLENLVHGMGMAFLLLLMIYINVMDFINPISVTVP
jgi:regulator of sigma E protease